MYIVVSTLFTYTKPFTEVLLLCHSFQNLSGPRTLKFPAKPKHFVALLSSDV